MKQPAYKVLPVNLDKAEFIVSLILSSSKKSNHLKSVLTLLGELQDQFRSRQKENRAFSQVAQVLGETYQDRLQATEHDLQRIEADLEQQEHGLVHLTDRRTSLQHELETCEAELNETRAYAEQRRNKKSKREKQYHQLYHVPLVAAQYKKKYMRARDKNSAAEEQVSSVRANVDAYQQDLTHMAKTVTELHALRETLITQRNDAADQLKHLQTLVFELQEGKHFLASFDAHQLETARKATDALEEHVLRKTNIDDEDTIRVFKMALYEYGEAEALAERRWGALEVEFQCSRCKVVHLGWPKPDKVRSHDLLCDLCYQDSHATMVFEKKLSGISSQLLLSLPRNSFSSTSTTTDSITSSSSSPKMKKIINMFKRSSSNSSFSK